MWINAAMPAQRAIIASFHAVNPSGHISCSVFQMQRNLADVVYSLCETRAVLWETLTWPQIQAMRDGGMDFCILPVGATEQHGPHLPVNTDSVLATACCMYASAKTSVPMLPTIDYGCSLGHTDRWPGTISLDPEALMATVRQIAGFLIRTGFKRLLIVNSHWGNTSSLRCAIDGIRFENAGRFQIGLKNSFEFTRSIWNQFIDDGEDFHANRAETALMMFLDPASVQVEKIEDDPDRTPGKVFTYVVPQTSRNGLTGYPSRATAADGRKLFIEMGEALAAFVTAARTETPPLEFVAQGKK
jgi:creatinine amidohydrolase